MSKVIVVGAGPSGMMAALAASKNHEVILIERNLSLIHISEPTRPY